MKAWVSGVMPGQKNLEIQQVPKPIVEDGYLLVRVVYASINFSDLLMIDDQYQVRPPRPFIPGQEVVGIVEAASPESEFQVGDCIAAKVLDSGFAEYVAVRQDMAIRVPSGFSLAQAAALPVSYITALVGLHYCAGLSANHTVLVHAAAGGVGLAAVEVSAAKGATVIATTGDNDRLAIARKHGAKHGINYREKDWTYQVKALTGGRGADVIFDPVGGDIGADSLHCIAQEGQYLIVGFASGKMPNLPVNRLLLKRASAKGVYWNHSMDPELVIDMQAELERLIAARQINPLIDDRYGFDELPQALTDLANRRVAGKLVLRISDEHKGMNDG